MHCTHCGHEIQDQASKHCIKCGQFLKAVKLDNFSNSNKKISNRANQKNRKKAMGWFLGPTAGLIAVFILWSIVSFVISQTSHNSTDSQTVASIINIILGFLGIIFVVGIIIGIPIGIHYISSSNKETEMTEYDERSGQGGNSVVPDEIRGWSWGAAGLGWIWGACHGVWISFLAFIPFVGWFWWIVMGIKGKEWAWQNSSWESVEHFKAYQRSWDRWGLAIFILFIILPIFAGIIGALFN